MKNERLRCMEFGGLGHDLGSSRWRLLLSLLLLSFVFHGLFWTL